MYYLLTRLASAATPAAQRGHSSGLWTEAISSPARQTRQETGRYATDNLAALPVPLALRIKTLMRIERR